MKWWAKNFYCRPNYYSILILFLFLNFFSGFAQAQSHLLPQAPNEACDFLLKKRTELSRKNAYDVFLKHDPIAQDVNGVFVYARSDEQFRSELNSVFESDRELRKISQQGLAFKDKIKAFFTTKLTPGQNPFRLATTPWSDLEGRYKKFKHLHQSSADLPKPGRMSSFISEISPI